MALSDVVRKAISRAEVTVGLADGDKELSGDGYARQSLAVGPDGTGNVAFGPFGGERMRRADTVLVFVDGGPPTREPLSPAINVLPNMILDLAVSWTATNG